jgi:hypothetical protein
MKLKSDKKTEYNSASNSFLALKRFIRVKNEGLCIELQGEAKNFGKADALTVAPRRNKGKLHAASSFNIL